MIINTCTCTRTCLYTFFCICYREKDEQWDQATPHPYSLYGNEEGWSWKGGGCGGCGGHGRGSKYLCVCFCENWPKSYVSLFFSQNRPEKCNTYFYHCFRKTSFGGTGQKMEGCTGEHHTAQPEPPVGQVLQVWEFGTATNQVLSKYTGQHAFNPKAAIHMTCVRNSPRFLNGSLIYGYIHPGTAPCVQIFLGGSHAENTISCNTL